MPPPACHSTFLPLADAAARSGSPLLDFVYQDIRSADDPVPLRCVWLLTASANPTICFDDNQLVIAGEGGAFADGRRWIDFGTTTELVREHGRFGQIRIGGVSIDEARKAHLLITEVTDRTPDGDLEDVEAQFFGLCRRDVGTTTLSPSRVLAATPTTFTLTYTCGEKGLPEDARVRFTCPLMLNPPQGDDPDAEGFCEVIESTAEVVYLEAATAPESHEKRDIHYRLPQGLPPHGRVVLRYRTSRMWTPAGRIQGVERRWWYSPLAPLTVGVSVVEGAPFVPPLCENGHALEIIPHTPDRLHLFLPGRRPASDDLRLVGIITDRYRNLARSPVRLRVKLRLVGVGVEDLPGPSSCFTDPHRFEMKLPLLTPGVYRVEAIDEDSGEVIAISNPVEVMAEDDPRLGIYWGEVHGHCAMSDGYGEFTTLLRHARDVAALDFAASADHACYFTDNEWDWMQDVNNATNKPGRFVTLNGYEWAGAQGHRNIHTSGDSVELYRGMYAPTADLGVVYEKLVGREDIVAGPHTRHTGAFWDRHNPEVERYIEIYSVWGCFEELAIGLLKDGARIGFTGGGDTHDARCGFSTKNAEASSGFYPGLSHPCGVTGAYMNSLDRPAVIAAMRSRSLLASTGARILLDFSVSGFDVGQEGVAPSANIIATIHACAPMAKVEIIRDGEPVHTLADAGLDIEIIWSDPDVAPGERWYFLKATQADGEVAWSSPVWLTV